MNHSPKAFIAATALIIAVLLSSCHKKAALPADTEDPAAPTDTLALVPEEGEAVASVQFPASFGEWTSVEVPVQVRLSSPRSFSVSGRATMVKGRDIFVSLRFIGLELGQLYANSDSVFLVEKVHKWYIAESLERLGGRTGLTIADLQGYLLGRPDRTVPQGIGGFDVLYDWNSASERLGAVGFSRNGVPVAGIAYGETEQTPAGPTASSVSIAAIPGGKTEISGTIEYRLGQAKWNSAAPDAVRFRPPGAGYSRISIDQLAKNL
ncbi:MAG: DUF4292 domain-containing protein [Muribaculaceae bacterium]|nr:DUF4292 domain-containing protein [Muribaculaceae bacterium]